MSNTSKKITRALGWILIGVVAFVPMVFDPHCLDSFSLPKWTLLVVLSIAGLGMSIADSLNRGKIQWKAGGGVMAFTVFFLALTATTILSPAPKMALFGIYAFRMDGFISWICYGVLFFVGLIYLHRDRLLAIIWASVISSLLICSYALVQYFGWDMVRWTSNPTGSRMWSSFGNPNFLAGFLVVVLPILLSLLFLPDTPLLSSIRSFVGLFDNLENPVSHSFVSDHKNVILIVAKSLIVCVLTMGLWSLALAQSRAAWLGSAIGLAVFLFLTKFSFSSINKKFGVALVSAIIVMACFIPWKGISNRLQAGIKLDSPEWILRRAGWESACSLVKEHPLISYGADGYQLSFRKHMDTSFFRMTHQTLMSPVYPHNETLQMAVNSGVVGLILYLIFLIFVARAGILNRGDPLWAGVSAALVGVWVNNQFSFHNVSTAALFYLLAGGLLGSCLRTRSIMLPRFFHHSLVRRIGIIGIASFGLVGAWFPLRMVLADRAFKKATTLDAKNNMEQALREYNRAVNLNPREITYLHRFAQVGLKLADHSPNPQIRRTWLEATANVYKGLLARNPVDAPGVNGLGTVHARLFQECRVPVAEQAEKEFLKAASLDPHFVEAWTNLGALYFALNRKRESLDAYLKAKDIDPYSAQTYNDLGIFHALQGQFPEAERYWRDALTLNPNFVEVQQSLQMLASGKLQQMYGGKK